MPTERVEDDTWTATCDRERCGFTSRNHPTKKAATERLGEHLAEHDETEGEA